MTLYRQFVATQSKRNPSIHNLHTLLESQQQERGACRIACLDFVSKNTGPAILQINANDLQAVLRPSYDPDGHSILGRTLIIEDIGRHQIETLGNAFRVDPMFFASHIYSTGPDIAFQTPEMIMLPTRISSKTWFNTYYHRTIVFQNAEIPETKLLRASNIDRKVMVIPKTKGVRIGLAQHSCSVLQTTLSNDIWICIILVDPPITNVFYHERNGRKELRQINLNSSHFLGGYEDFLEPPFSESDGPCCHAPLRSGLFDDLIYYWKRRQPPCFNKKSPSLLHHAYFPLRIVAAEWNSYLTVMHHSIKQYEYTVEDSPALFPRQDRLNADLQALQSWRRRSMSSQQKLWFVSRFVRSRLLSSDPFSDHLELLAQDFDQLAADIDDFGLRLERMLPVVTSILQIADSRRSFVETTDVKRLTYLALVFVPLTFTAGLFSMNSETAPGAPGFWQFFAVAIPMMLVVFLVARPPVREAPKLKDYMKGTRKLLLPRYNADEASADQRTTGGV